MFCWAGGPGCAAQCFLGEDTGVTWPPDQSPWSSRCPPQGCLGAVPVPPLPAPLLPRESWARMSAPCSMSSRTISSLPTQAAKDRGCSPGDKRAPWPECGVRWVVSPSDRLFPHLGPGLGDRCQQRQRQVWCRGSGGVVSGLKSREAGPSQVPWGWSSAQPPPLCSLPPLPRPPPALALARALTKVDEVAGAVAESCACSSCRDAGPVGKQGFHQVHVLVHDGYVQRSLTWLGDSPQSRGLSPGSCRGSLPYLHLLLFPTAA